MTFVLGVGELAEVALVPKLLARVQKSAPGVIIQTQLVPNSLYRNSSLESGLFDAILHSRPIQGSALANRRVGGVEIVGLIRADLLPRDGMTLDFYSSCPHIVSSSGDRNANIDHALEKYGLIRKVGAVVQNFLVMATAAASTGHISHMPRTMANKIASALGLAIFDPPLPITDFPLYITWHERLSESAPLQWLFEQIELSLAGDVEAKPTETGCYSEVERP